MNVLKHKGYSARVGFDSEDNCFVGRLEGINDLVGFHASTFAEFECAFREAVDDYIETLNKIRISPQAYGFEQ